MRIALSKHASLVLVAVGLVAAGGSAKAAVFLPSPSLPLIGVPYMSPNGGAGCFDVASACVTPGLFYETSVVSSIFVPAMGMLPAVQDIIADATYSATLTPIGGNMIIGSVSLTGTVDETVEGRTSNTQTGTFATDLTGVSLSGKLMLPGTPLNGDTLDVMLNGSKTSSGTTTISSMGPPFRIDSFFDIFVDVSLVNMKGDTIASTSVGPVLVVAVPEPSTWAMMLIGFAGLGFAACRRARVAALAD
jgi:PEP-CTERM motif